MKKNTYRDDMTPAPSTSYPRYHDPKYEFREGRIWNGEYWIPMDEPVIVFRGKDQATIAAITGYIECLMKQEQTPHVVEHIESAKHRLQAIMDFQTSRPEFVGIGCGIDEKLKEY